jgi:hypothetical protein
MRVCAWIWTRNCKLVAVTESFAPSVTMTTCSQITCYTVNIPVTILSCESSACCRCVTRHVPTGRRCNCLYNVYLDGPSTRTLASSSLLLHSLSSIDELGRVMAERSSCTYMCFGSEVNILQVSVLRLK